MMKLVLFFSFILSIQQAVSQSTACYGHLQDSPAFQLRDSRELAFTPNGTLYLYTSLLESTSCETGKLKEFSFCYNPYCSPTAGKITDSPVFYVLLLHNTGSGYSVAYIHKERQIDRFCHNIEIIIGPSASCCCRTVNSTKLSSVSVNSSLAVAFLMPNDSSGSYFYGFDETSLETTPGFVVRPPPAVPAEGEVLQFEGNPTPSPLPKRLFRVSIGLPVITTAPSPSTTPIPESAADFIMNNIILVAGVAVALVALLAACFAVLFLVCLKLKHNKNVEIRAQREPEAEPKRKKSSLPNIEIPNVLSLELGDGNTNMYEDMGGEGYIQMAASPVRDYSFRVKRSGSISGSLRMREELNTHGQVMYDPTLPDVVDEFLTPARDEEALYEQCKWLNLTHINRDSIYLGEELGSGQFGTVVKGEWSKESDKEGEEGKEKEKEKEAEAEKELLEVAVKTLKKGAASSSVIKFLQEAAIMWQFNHPNVVKLYGVVINGEPKMLILELLSGGDLTKVLTDMRPSNNKSVDSDVPHTLLSYCRQVASGMTYLSNKGFIHRDLAARNILISEDGSCKIADFGMARDLIDENYYITQGGRIPVKWTAPEALNYKKFSTASDVWSFGVVMYEIWSLGHEPFEACNNSKTMEMLEKGQRMAPPPGCPKAIYSLMIQCWHSVASKRPSFAKVLQQLSLPDTRILRLHSQAADEDGKILTTSLGEDLSSATNLFKDLQETYCTPSK